MFARYCSVSLSVQFLNCLALNCYLDFTSEIESSCHLLITYLSYEAMVFWSGFSFNFNKNVTVVPVTIYTTFREYSQLNMLSFFTFTTSCIVLQMHFLNTWPRIRVSWDLVQWL